MKSVKEDTRIEEILKKLEPDFRSLGIISDDIKRSIAYELETFSRIIIDSYKLQGRKKIHKHLKKNSKIVKENTLKLSHHGM